MNRIETPDWPACIRRLEKSGLSQYKIADRVGSSPATVNRIKNQHGYKPSYDTGAALLICLGEIQE